MTVNEAIRALTEARDTVGSEAPLLMTDGPHVIKLPIGDGCVYVRDVPQPEPAEEPEGACWATSRGGTPSTGSSPTLPWSTTTIRTSKTPRGGPNHRRGMKDERHTVRSRPPAAGGYNASACHRLPPGRDGK